jgi:hypothetical protein
MRAPQRQNFMVVVSCWGMFSCQIPNYSIVVNIWRTSEHALMHILERFECLNCKLKKLNICRCESLEEVPNGLGKLIACNKLVFLACKSVKHLPQGLGHSRF